MAELKAPMAGKVIEINVKVGDLIEIGETAIVIESMKMEIPIAANASGKVVSINCNVDDAVNNNTVLIVIE